MYIVREHHSQTDKKTYEKTLDHLELYHEGIADELAGYDDLYGETLLTTESKEEALELLSTLESEVHTFIASNGRTYVNVTEWIIDIEELAEDGEFQDYIGVLKFAKLGYNNLRDEYENELEQLIDELNELNEDPDAYDGDEVKEKKERIEELNTLLGF